MTALTHHPQGFGSIPANEYLRIGLHGEELQHREHELHPENTLIVFDGVIAEPQILGPDHLTKRHIVDEIFRRTERVDVGDHDTLPSGCPLRLPCGKPAGNEPQIPTQLSVNLEENSTEGKLPQRFQGLAGTERSTVVHRLSPNTLEPLSHIPTQVREGLDYDTERYGRTGRGS